MEGKVGGSKVQVRYTVENRGGEPLILGTPATSCGCSVASIEPKVIPPGGVGVIVVDGDAPRSGERSVEIRIGANAPATPELTAQLVMVGVSPLPYVVMSSGPINFGELATARGVESFYIEAHEKKTAAPWLSSARSTLPSIAVTGGLKQESDLGKGVVFRRYEFKATLDLANPSPQAYAGDVRVGSESVTAAPYSIPVRFTIQPPVFARPSQ